VGNFLAGNWFASQAGLYSVEYVTNIVRQDEAITIIETNLAAQGEACGIGRNITLLRKVLAK
jgi:hypothetical protein